MAMYLYEQAARGRGRGFAGMDEERQREIASMGGRASGGNFARNPSRASAAGRKGGRSRRRSTNQSES